MITRIINQAQKWVGYKEKSSPFQLEDFNANVGYGNYTIFNRDYNRNIGSRDLNAEWCDTFIECCFYYEFGLVEGRRYLDNNFNLYDGLLKDITRRIDAKKNLPAPGDIAVFFDLTMQAGGHVGLVTEVTDTKIKTIEGNIPEAFNGGEVVARSYSFNYPYIYYYCRPLYNSIQLGDRVLSQGMQGDDVRELQTALNITVDGNFGPYTTAALKQFQAANDLLSDGIAGKTTVSKIKQNVSIHPTTKIEDKITRTLRYGVIGYDVKWLQEQLTDKGYSCGSIDGIFGNKTQTAVKQFQKDNNLVVDGIVGKQTIAALQ